MSSQVGVDDSLVFLDFRRRSSSQHFPVSQAKDMAGQ
ncbi:uncharacterized protein METZ01_LOCUS396942, partial [marine metagenome]